MHHYNFMMTSGRDWSPLAINPTKLAITQLNFKSETYERQTGHPRMTIVPSLSLHNWNKNFVLRTHLKRKTKAESNKHQLFGLLEEVAGEPKNNMFMAWKDRTHSAYSKMLPDRTIKRAYSERKIREPPNDLASRRLTALPKQRLTALNPPQEPGQLMGLKLEWQEKRPKRINPTAQAKLMRIHEVRKDQRNNLMRISGWQAGQNEFDPYGL